MTAPFWLLCGSIWGRIKHAATNYHYHHYAHRIGRAVRRAAGIAISKPAIVGWTCLAIGGGGWWGAGMPSLSAPPYAEIGPTSGGIAGDFWPLDYFPPEFGLETPEIDISALMLPEITSGGSEQTLVGETAGRPVPEPASLVLLVTAAGIFVVARRVRP